LTIKVGDLVTFNAHSTSVWVDPDPFDDKATDLSLFEWHADEPAVVLELAHPESDFRWVKLFILTRVGWYFEEDLELIEEK
jgi:hypothetical protein